MKQNREQILGNLSRRNMHRDNGTEHTQGKAAGGGGGGGIKVECVRGARRGVCEDLED